MEHIGNIKVLFIAGFGPIIGDGQACRELYAEALNITFKEENDGYLHTEAPRASHCGRCAKRQSPASEAISGLTRFLGRKLGLNLT